jgi:hypothetical protein
MKAGLQAVTFRFHSLTGGVPARPPDDVYNEKRQLILARRRILF